MPYKDLQRQREYMQTWRGAHPERIRAYQRAAVLRSAITKRRFPAMRSLNRHSLTTQELMDVVVSVASH